MLPHAACVRSAADLAAVKSPPRATGLTIQQRWSGASFPTGSAERCASSKSNSSSRIVAPPNNLPYRAKLCLPSLDGAAAWLATPGPHWLPSPQKMRRSTPRQQSTARRLSAILARARCRSSGVCAHSLHRPQMDKCGTDHCSSLPYDCGAFAASCTRTAPSITCRSRFATQ